MYSPDQSPGFVWPGRSLATKQNNRGLKGRYILYILYLVVALQTTCGGSSRYLQTSCSHCMATNERKIQLDFALIGK